MLWREVVSLRQNHTQQQKVMNKVSQCVCACVCMALTSYWSQNATMEGELRSDIADISTLKAFVL